ELDRSRIEFLQSLKEFLRLFLLLQTRVDDSLAVADGLPREGMDDLLLGGLVNGQQAPQLVECVLPRLAGGLLHPVEQLADLPVLPKKQVNNVLALALRHDLGPP